MTRHDECLVLAEVLVETIVGLQADEPAGEPAPALHAAIDDRAETTWRRTDANERQSPVRPDR